MKNNSTRSRLLLFLVLIAISIPFSMGCFESPLESALNNETIIEDTISTVDSGDVADTTEIEDPIEPSTSSVLRRNYSGSDSGGLLDILNSTLRVITRLLGGVVSILDMTLEIPALSLDRNTNITVNIPDPNLYIYDFGPDGLQFNIPATITISYEDAILSGVDESKIKLAWWDDNAQAWVIMPCTVDYAANIVSGPIEHFSAYGLVSD